VVGRPSVSRINSPIATAFQCQLEQQRRLADTRLTHQHRHFVRTAAGDAWPLRDEYPQ
jgi:hypothetical protein